VTLALILAAIAAYLLVVAVAGPSLTTALGFSAATLVLVAAYHAQEHRDR
jgi:hypothetical protein